MAPCAGPLKSGNPPHDFGPLHRAIARLLGGEVSGEPVLAPGPGYSPRDRSLSIRLSPSAPAGFVVHSHSGDGFRTCRDYVRERLGLPRSVLPAAEVPRRESLSPRAEVLAARRDAVIRKTVANIIAGLVPILGTPRRAIFVCGSAHRHGGDPRRPRTRRRHRLASGSLLE